MYVTYYKYRIHYLIGNCVYNMLVVICTNWLKLEGNYIVPNTYTFNKIEDNWYIFKMQKQLFSVAG